MIIRLHDQKKKKIQQTTDKLLWKATSASTSRMVWCGWLFHVHYGKRRKLSALELQMLCKYDQAQCWSIPRFHHSSSWLLCPSMMFQRSLCKLCHLPWLMQSLKRNNRRKMVLVNFSYDKQWMKLVGYLHLWYLVFAIRSMRAIKLVNDNWVIGSNKRNLFKRDPPSKSSTTLMQNTSPIIFNMMTQTNRNHPKHRCILKTQIHKKNWSENLDSEWKYN